MVVFSGGIPREGKVPDEGRVEGRLGPCDLLATIEVLGVHEPEPAEDRHVGRPGARLQQCTMETDFFQQCLALLAEEDVPGEEGPVPEPGIGVHYLVPSCLGVSFLGARARSCSRVTTAWHSGKTHALATVLRCLAWA